MGAWIALIIILVILLWLFLANVRIVPQAQAYVIETLGKYTVTWQAGLHFKIPFVQKVIEIDNRTKKIQVDASAASKDLQTVTCEVAVNYKVINSFSSSIYKNVGRDYEDIIIAPAIQESIKAVTAQFTAEELITQRQIVSDKIKEILAAKIGSYGMSVEVFNIVDFNFSAEFNAAVEAKQTAEQNALKAQQDLARIEIEAKQKVVQSQAEAESIRLIQDTLSSSPEYIDYIKWNKWDGVLPVYLGGDAATILDVGDITKD